jgi:hypothetical protein
LHHIARLYLLLLFNVYMLLPHLCLPLFILCLLIDIFIPIPCLLHPNAISCLPILLLLQWLAEPKKIKGYYWPKLHLIKHWLLNWWSLLFLMMDHHLTLNGPGLPIQIKGVSIDQELRHLFNVVHPCP